MSLQHKVYGGVKQRVAGTDKLRQGFARHSDEFFFKGHALIAGGYGVACADNPVSIADDGGNMRGLKAFGLSFPQCSTKSFEGFIEEGGDKMRLQPSSLGPFHLVADGEHARCIH